MKRWISICLCMAMLLSMSSTLSVCAVQSEVNVKQDAQTDLERDAVLLTERFFGANAIAADEQDEVSIQVASDLALLEDTAFRHLVELENANDGMITYKITFDEVEVTNYLNVGKSAEGDTVVRITEGDKEDLWIYKENGEIYFNGVRMKECEVTSVLASTESGSISPRAGMMFKMRAAPKSYFNQNPKSIADMFSTDYQNRYTYLKSTYLAEVTLPGQIKTLTLSSVVNALMSAVQTKLLKLDINVLELAVSTALNTAIAIVKDVGSAVILSYRESDSLSYKIHKYVYKQNNSLYAEYIYAVDSYANKGYYGDNFVWGVLEEGNAT